MRKEKNDLNIFVFFGVPGSGKSTFAAYIAKRNHRKHIKTYCNFPLKYTYTISSDDIGFWEISDGQIIIDEAGVDFNNRLYKSMQKPTIEFFKKARKRHISAIYIFSQNYEDMDITLRRMARKFFLVRRSGLFITIKAANCDIDIDKDTHQFIEKYSWSLLRRKRIFAPLYWRMFDSYAVDPLPVKDFPYVS